MRLSVRIASATLLILAIFLIKRHLDGLQDDARVQSAFWHWDFFKNPQSASPDHSNPPNPDIINQSALDEPPERPPPTYETTPIIVPNDRVIVIAKLASEDTSWVSNDLAEYVHDMTSFPPEPGCVETKINLLDGATSSTPSTTPMRPVIPPRTRAAKVSPTCSTSSSITTISPPPLSLSTVTRTAGPPPGILIPSTTAMFSPFAPCRPILSSETGTPIYAVRKPRAVRTKSARSANPGPAKPPKKPTPRPGRSSSTTPMCPR